MENQLESTKVMKKLKVENFTLTANSNVITATCVMDSDLSLPYERRLIDIDSFVAFQHCNERDITYSLETGKSLIHEHLSDYLNAMEHRTEEMEEPFFPKSAYQLREENPITNILKPFL